MSIERDVFSSAGGDRFGNVWVNRIPKTVSDEVDDDPTGRFSLISPPSHPPPILPPDYRNYEI